MGDFLDPGSPTMAENVVGPTLKLVFFLPSKVVPGSIRLAKVASRASKTGSGFTPRFSAHSHIGLKNSGRNILGRDSYRKALFLTNDE